MKSTSSRIRKLAATQRNLQVRYVILQGILILFWILTVFIILALADVFSILESYDSQRLNNELKRTESIATDTLNTISLNCNRLVEDINHSISNTLLENNIDASDIKSTPSILNTLLESQVEKSLFAMQRSDASGVFVILNSTINPSLPHANKSKAGFYIKNTESSPVSYVENIPVLLRGSADVARKFDMYLDTEWQLEFEIDDTTCYYSVPYKNGVKHKKHDSKYLGYWTSPYLPDSNHQKCIAYAIPLVGDDGACYGVCGIEISQRFLDDFMSIDSSGSDDLFCILTHTDKENSTDLMDCSLCFGPKSNTLLSSNDSQLIQKSIGKGDNTNTYKYDDTQLMGMETTLNIYSSKSVHHTDRWKIIVLSSKLDKKSNTAFLIGALLLLFALSIILAHILSKVYTKPISSTFKKIINNDSDIKKTDIEEIDALIEYIKSTQYKREGDGGNSKSDLLIENSATEDERMLFAQRLETLTKTEREILNFYLKGQTTKHICDERCISMNTLKTHSSRIYSKMYVNSRAKLLSYCYEMMAQSIEATEDK